MTSQKMDQSNFQFDVFLSYSRKDEAFGRRLEEALENYTLPKSVSARSISTKRLNVFRDKKDLVPSDSDYYKAIDGYLKRSRYLVVICSPNARRSEYVNQEIKTYLQSHDANQVIAVLLSGKPNNDSQASPDEYAFPQALCDAVAMPLAVDYVEYQRAPGKLNKGRYHDAWYTLLSKIFGTERAEIERVDARRQARRRAIFAGVTIAIIAVLSVALVFAVISRQQATSERDHAQQLLYASDMNLAQRAFDSGNVGLGTDLLEAHQPKAGERDLRGFEWYYLWRLYNAHLASFPSTDDLAFSRDGSRFATVSGSHIKIWDTDSRREVGDIPLPAVSSDSPLFNQAVEFSPDGNTLAYGDGTRGTFLIQINSGLSRKIPLPILGEQQRQNSVLDSEEGIQRYFDELASGGTPRFSPDGKLLAVNYSCGVVAVYEASSLQQVTTLGDGPPASGCTSFVNFSPDGKLLAYGNLYGFSLWDTVTHKNLPEPDPRTGGIEELESIAFSPDSRLLAIGDRSQEVVLWNISTRKVVGRLKGHEGFVSALAFSPDGKTLLSGGMDHTVKLWDFSSYRADGRTDTEHIKVFSTLKGHTGSIASIKFAANRSIFATVANDRTAKFWSVGAGKEFETISDIEAVFPETCMAVGFAGEGEKNTFSVLDLAGETRTLPIKIDDAPTIVSRDRKLFAFRKSSCTPSNCSVDVFEAGSRDKLVSMPTRSDDNFPSFSQDNRFFTAIGADSKSVMIWDTVERKDVSPIKNDVELKSYLVSPDGKLIVTFDKAGGIKSWDISSQRQVAQLVKTDKAAKIEDESFGQTDPHVISPDGELLAFSDATKLQLSKVKTGETLAVGDQEMGDRVSVIAFSPDGKLLAAGDESGRVRIWDSFKRQQLANFMGHRDSVTSLAFTTDGRTLASSGGARDGAVKLYSMSAMRELLTLTHEPSPTSETHALQGTEDAISQVFFSPDGRALVTQSGNSILRIWRGKVPPNSQ